MSKKTLNAVNLEKLGAEKLAGLVMELVKGNAALQRRARMELSAAQGPKDVAADVRKRFASIRRSKSSIGWRRQKAVVKDLRDLLSIIDEAIVPENPDLAFELLWSFLELAPSLQARTDDGSGAIGGVMTEAVQLVAKVAPKIAIDPEKLAESILEAVAGADYGEFDGIIPATAPALGESGLKHLHSITTAWADTAPSEAEIAAYQGCGFRPSSIEQSLRRARNLTRTVILADVADALGDVDGYMGVYSSEQLAYGTIAPGVARRLLDAGRLEEALEIVSRARDAEAERSSAPFHSDLDGLYEECLEKQGKMEELKAHLWARFEKTLSAHSLRRYLKLLPDFDDIEAEEKALAYAESYPHLGVVVDFVINWPAPERAERVVVARADELDGNAYYALTPAAEALERDAPLAATLMRRAMIRDTLEGAKYKRYKHAARHLEECEAWDASIQDYGDVPSHAGFIEELKKTHGRNQGFWRLVDG